MFQLLERINLNQDRDRIRILHWGVFALIVLSLFNRCVDTSSYFYFIISTAIISGFYVVYFRTLKRYYYTFWTLSFCVSLYLLVHLFRSIFILTDLKLFYLYTLATLLLALELWVLSSPIYYPLVSWWEYDFRYRTDLKIKVTHNENSYDSRIVDLRRESIGLQSFENFKVGDYIKLTYEDKASVKCEIVSKRSYSIGRPYVYGLRVIDINEDFNHLVDVWKSRRQNIKKLKSSRG